MCAPGGDAEPGLDHAAEHDAEPERARRVRHPHRLADPAGLRELDVDPVRALGARARRRRARGSPRRRRSGPASGASAPARPGRRPASGCSQYSSIVSCGRSSSASSSDHASLTSHWSGRSVDRAHRADALDVEPVAAAELQLQALEPAAADLLRAARHVVGIAEPDRPRRRRPGPPQAEQLVDRQAEQLPLQVVQRVRRARRAPRPRPAAAGRRSRRARTGRRRRSTCSSHASADSADWS